MHKYEKQQISAYRQASCSADTILSTDRTLDRSDIKQLYGVILDAEQLIARIQKESYLKGCNLNK